MKNHSIKLFLFTICFLLMQKLFSQNSPLSGFGLGMLTPQGNIAQQSMGSVGVSTSNSFWVNTLNPALLVRNGSVIFDAGYNFKIQQLRSDKAQQSFTTGNFNYATLALPITKKWTSAIGLQPYSYLEYLTETSAKVENSDFFAYYTFKGEGGLNNFFWANGFMPIKNLSLGVKMSYLFGNLTRESVTELIASGQNSRIAFLQRDNINQITWNVGTSYRYPLEKDRKFLNFGLTYDLSAQMKTKRFEAFEKRDFFGNNLIAPSFVDTLTTIKGKTFLPARLRVGVSYEKLNHYTIHAEMISQNWSQFRRFDIPDTQLTNRLTFAIGGEWTPEFGSNKFLNRSTYRIGFNHTPQILQIEGKTLAETNFSLGGSFAFSGGQGKLTYLHLGIIAGQRGNLSRNGLQERYIEARLGVSLSDVLWFYRPKID
ncbi:hypothetical protein Rain11_1206 [Raineya orbicola]|jgi:hypothetical protein|uniref:Outer membrane protein transport protein (OMPP1/FadL/TodX) n=2 Tax=Raineya orbicola TaxID=2016530 RepID=A0A2N3IHI1_9BACT|nr:hypothetical protein Rain11_1206 [Raineya orbicola]